VIAPFAKAGHVSHVVYDHTSILQTTQHKWNLPPLTRRDAAAAGKVGYARGCCQNDLLASPAGLGVSATA